MLERVGVSRRWAALATVTVCGFGVWVPGAWAASSASYFTALSGQMTIARYGAAAAPLPDGQVLIAGGENGSGPQSSAEVFDPTTGTFAATGSMTYARYGAVAAPLPDGDVLIAGGASSGAYLTSAEVYDPANGTFKTVGSMTTPRAFAVAASLPDGQVLIAGGANLTGPLSSAEVFDPATGMFTALSAQMTTARKGAVAAPLSDGNVLIAGGDSSSGTVLQSAEEFDPATGTFTALSAQMTVARYGAVAAPLSDGNVLIAGGEDSSSSFVSSAEVFDPATGTFTATGSMTTTREGAAAAPLPDGQVLIAGGEGNTSGYLQSAEVFEPAPEASVTGGGFGDQTVAQPSMVQTLLVTNVGSQVLSIAGASLGGADPGDFTIDGDSCAARRLAFEQSCTIQVQFTPSAAGARTATLSLQDNEPVPASITLSGNGVPANSGPAGVTGPAGTTGPAGATGPAGPRGARGRPGEILLVSCRTVIATIRRHGHRVKVRRYRCTSRHITGTVRFTTTGARARLVRGHVLYASGSIRHGRLMLHARRGTRPGRYTLILTHRHGHRLITTHRTITIT